MEPMSVNSTAPSTPNHREDLLVPLPRRSGGGHSTSNGSVSGASANNEGFSLAHSDSDSHLAAPKASRWLLRSIERPIRITLLSARYLDISINPKIRRYGSVRCVFMQSMDILMMTCWRCAYKIHVCVANLFVFHPSCV